MSFTDYVTRIADREVPSPAALRLGKEGARRPEVSGMSVAADPIDRVKRIWAEMLAQGIAVFVSAARVRIAATCS
jgi:hypothetical protein